MSNNLMIFDHPECHRIAQDAQLVGAVLTALVHGHKENMKNLEKCLTGFLEDADVLALKEVYEMLHSVLQHHAGLD